MSWKRRIRYLAAAGPLVLLWAVTLTPARIEHNRLGAFLVFPLVLAENGGGSIVETFLTVSNLSQNSVVAHVSFIDGDQLAATYCFECDFDIPLSGLATETLVFTRSGATTQIRRLTTGTALACQARMGFVTVALEDAAHNVLTDNILIGDQVTVDYANGASVSLEAIPIQGQVGDGNRTFRFDGLEYEALPATIASEFIAPDFTGPLGGELVLLTLGFQRQFPPVTDCAVTGIDAQGAAFTTGLQFGCWTRISLASIDPEFTYPFLGTASGEQEHGWLRLSCTVYGTGSGNPTPASGGVLGAIVQTAASGAVLRRNPAGPTLPSRAQWGRPMQQSVVVGDAIVLQLQSAPGKVAIEGVIP